VTKGWAIADGRMSTNTSRPVCVQVVGAYRHSTGGVHLAIHSMVPLLEAQHELWGDDCTCSVSGSTMPFSECWMKL
jgi:hypothetical protein